MSADKEMIDCMLDHAEDDRIARMGYIDGILSNLDIPEDTYHTLLKYIMEYGDTLYDIGVLDQAMSGTTYKDILENYKQYEGDDNADQD
jgi:hypothetical protein